MPVRSAFTSESSGSARPSFIAAARQSSRPTSGPRIPVLTPTSSSRSTHRTRVFMSGEHTRHTIFQRSVPVRCGGNLADGAGRGPPPRRPPPAGQPATDAGSARGTARFTRGLPSGHPPEDLRQAETFLARPPHDGEFLRPLEEFLGGVAQSFEADRPSPKTGDRERPLPPVHASEIRRDHDQVYVARLEGIAPASTPEEEDALDPVLASELTHQTLDRRIDVPIAYGRSRRPTHCSPSCVRVRTRREIRPS